MTGNMSIVLLACLSLLAIAQAHGPKCGLAAMKECCPSLPSLLNEESVKSCKPPMPEGGEGPGGRGPPPPTGPGGRGPPPPTGSGGPVAAPQGVPAGAAESAAARGRQGFGKMMGGFKHGPGGPHNMSCVMECAFEKDGFITVGADGKKIVNLDAVNKKLTEVGTGAWETIVKEAITSCTTTAPVVKSDSSCTSGSGEIGRCLMEIFMAKCPDAVNSAECKERKERMAMKGEMKGEMKETKGKMAALKEKMKSMSKGGKKGKN